MAPCSECGALIDIVSDHARWCPERVAAQQWTNPDGSAPQSCPVCGVDHRWASADLSHGIVRLLLHAIERASWKEYPANGDMIARQRAGIVPESLIYTINDPEDFDWERIGA